MLLNVAFEFHKKSDVLKLGVNGLGLQTTGVKTSLHNNAGDITMAMHDVLEGWRTSQKNDRVAYVNLCEALNAVDMNSIINKVLEKK